MLTAPALTQKQADILITLDNAPDVSAGTIGRYCSTCTWVGWDDQGITTTLQRLAARGLTKRRENPEWQGTHTLRTPRWLWSLTRAGEAALAEWLDLAPPHADRL